MTNRKIISFFSLGVFLMTPVAWPLFLAGCKSSPSPVEIFFDPREHNLPFPSNLIHTVSDDKFPTGYRLSPRLDPDQSARLALVFPELESELSLLDGFSPSGPILVQFSGWIDLDSLTPTPASATQPGSSIFLLNSDPDSVRLGEKCPFHWKFDWDNNVLAIRPLIPLEPGKKHVLVITDRLQDENGRAVRSSDFFRLMKADYTLTESLESYRQIYLSIFPRISELLGLSRESVSLAVEFTTSASGQSPLKSLIADLNRRPFPLLDSLVPVDAFPGNLSYRGELLLPYYLDWKGKLVSTDPVSGRYPALLPGYDISFTLTFPSAGTITLPGGSTASVAPPFPLVIVQPDLFASGSPLTPLLEDLPQNGIATLLLPANLAAPVSLYPRGATETAVPVWRKFPGLNLEARSFDPVQFRDYFLQAAAALSLLIQSLPKISSLDLYPRSSTSTGDGIPDLNLTRVGFFGELSGAVPGFLSLSLQTEVLSGVFRRAGGAWPEIILDHPLWSAALDSYLRQNGLSSLDLYLLRAWLGPLLDPADPINFFPAFLSEETGGAGLHNLLLQAFIPDPLVSNSASFALTRAYGIPLLQPCLQSESGTEIQESPATLNIQGLFSGGMSEFPGSVFPPGVTDTLQADRQAAQFFSSSFYSGQAVIINPE